ncbi:MAG: extracellular solute-binding protein, partial [Acutalibacteraceae bacterium]|nr:extracellular solute-binding protein [Acutalibacteraceae bacterium]
LLSQSRTEPVNLGMRGALYDLKNFEDYEDVLKRFQKGAEIPYLYKNACYALPDTQLFFCMFYRKDIFENLGLEVPKTWDEFIKTSAVIQRNNMEIYIPYTQIATSTVVNQGIGILNLYPTLMQQSGLSLYNKDRTATTLSSADAINVFEYWTRMYSDYKFVKESDFYNRFRMGLMPLGISAYSTIFTLEEMAPEVQGKWAIAPVPGFSEQSNTIAGGGGGCSIVQKSPNKESAWEFLKWWTSADTQFEYSNRVESILGLVGRISTSNVEALNRMDWDKDQLKILNEQWAKVNELEEIPGSYYVIRALDQAYWAVINNKMNAMDALSYWSDSADDEIERKCREYGYIKEN